MNVSFLGEFIARHDGCKLVGKDTLTGTIYISGESVQPSGEVVKVIEQIPATLQAVRDWLGY